MARGPTTQRVGFASEVQSIRQPRDDENSVMSHFAKHATRCGICNDPYDAYRRDIPLCERGTALAKDVATYIYAKGGKPYSLIDRNSSGERIQIQIPAGMEVISLLIKAIDRGLILNKREKPVIVVPKSEKVEVEKIERPYLAPRTEPNMKVARRKEYPDERRYRQGDVEIVEIVPVSRRDRKEKAYHTDRAEDRSRYERKDRPKSVIYSERKGSLYQKDEEEKRRRQRYEQEPIVIVAEPRSPRYLTRR